MTENKIDACVDEWREKQLDCIWQKELIKLKESLRKVIEDEFKSAYIDDIGLSFLTERKLKQRLLGDGK